MRVSARLITAVLALRLVVIGCCRVAEAQDTERALVQKIALVGDDKGMAVQIGATALVPVESQLLTAPDRLVIDFAGALPGSGVRGFRLNQGHVVAVRIGLLRSNPPVTRIVIDLDAPVPYRLVSAGKNIVVGLGENPADSSAKRRQTLGGVTQGSVEENSKPALTVLFARGLLTIAASNASLADILYQVHLKTGAMIAIPDGAEQERIAIQAAGPVKDVLASLLNGSRYNFVLTGALQDAASLGTVILVPKSDKEVDGSSSAGTSIVSSATVPPTAPIAATPSVPAAQLQTDPEMPPAADPDSIPDH